MAAAVDHFGRQGYDDTKWSDVAADVGLGSTALYHYFESKLHCLFELMSDTLQTFRVAFDEVTAAHENVAEGVEAMLRRSFDMTEAEVLECRVLVAEQGRISVTRDAVREEEARSLARERTRELELAWATYLARGMEQGVVRDADPQLLTRALLGMYNSIWHWYRPRGTLSLDDVAAFYVPHLLTMAGIGAAAPRRR